jgi:hypothetical protein
MFKYKPQKSKIGSDINTINNIHKRIISNFNNQDVILENKKKQLSALQDRLYRIRAKLKFSKNDVLEQTKILNEIDTINHEIDNIETHKDELDYYFKTHNILIDYFDDNSITKEMSQEEPNEIKNNKNKLNKKNKKIEVTHHSTDIISILSNNTNENNQKILQDTSGSNASIIKQTSNKATLLNDFLSVIGKTNNSDNIQFSKICQRCNIEKNYIQSDGVIVCLNCGETEYVICEVDIVNYKEHLHDKPAYPYKRVKHFVECLSQFQAKESTDIPISVFEQIMQEIKKNKITNLKEITMSKLKSILKKLRLNQYYEHIPYILSRITGNPAPSISRETEEKLKTMFRETQPYFKKYCPKNRVNFLSYSYVLHKLCELLELDEYAKCFPLLKSREKLRLQDEIWKQICCELKWEFYPSI